MFTTKGITDGVGESKYIAPGVHVVTITKIEGFTPEGKSPYVRFTFADSTGKTVDSDFFFSENATETSLKKIKHIATKIVTEGQVDSINVATVGEYAYALSKLLTGKAVKIKFRGKEIAGKDGKNNWFKAEIGLPKFAEKITENTLTFNPDKDFIKLSSVTSTPATVTNDLPF